MSLATSSLKSPAPFASTSPIQDSSAASPPPPVQLKPPTVAPTPDSRATKVTVEVPTSSTLPFNPFDPHWVKLWEQVGPISYLALLCVFVWLLTRLVETVKGK